MRFIRHAVLAVLSILPLGVAHAQTLSPHTITVAGTSTIRVAPDTALVTVNLNSTGETSHAALQADKGVLARLVEAVRPFHFATSDVQTSNINITQLRSPSRMPAQDPLPPGNYQVTDHLTVTVDDLSKVAAVIDALTQAAANVSINVQFNLKDRTAVEDKAKVEAIANARQQADILAAAEGAKVDRMIAISTSDVGNYLPNLNFVELLAGSNPQGKIAVTQRVMVEYGLQ
jgi:uncharacterized protein YggE